MDILLLNTCRSHYSQEEAASSTLTAGQLKRMLEEYDDETPVVTCATMDCCKYGTLNYFSLEEVDTDDEE